MNDTVLHRKFFREKALRVGAIKPRRYVLGAPEGGIVGNYPVTTEGPSYNPFTTKTKGSRVYSIDPKGNVVSTGYLPATIPPAQQGVGKVFQGIEAVVDPIGAYERGTYRKIGQTIFNPKTYTEGLPALAKGAGNIVKRLPGYAAVEEVIDRAIPDTGNTLLDSALNIAPLLASEAALASKRGAGYAARPLLTRAGITTLASPAMLARFANPYVAAGGTVAAPFLIADYYHKEKMKNDPEYAANFQKQMEEYGREVDPETSMMMYGAPQKLSLKDVTPLTESGGGPGATGPDLGGGIPPGMGGTTSPIQVPGVGTTKPLGDFKPKENTFVSNLENTSKKLSTGQKGETGSKDKVKPLNIFDKLGNFARTASGNMFLLKLAAGLLSGKGNFGEVLGNALNPAVDLFAAYRLKEQELDTKLIEAQRKMIAKANKDLKINVGSYPLQLKDGTISQVPAFQNDKTKETTYVFQGKEYKVPVNEVGQFSLKKAEADKNTIKLIGKVGDNIAANALVTDLLLQNPQTLGTSGAAKYLFNRVVGVAGAIGDLGKNVSYKDIIDVNTGEVVTGAEAKKMKDLGKRLDDKFKIIEKDYKNLDENTKGVLAKNGVTAQTLKYFLANAFKDEDRLTNRDLEYIDKITNILTPFKDGDLVQAELREVQSYLKNKQDNYIRQLRREGYDDYSIAKEMYGTIGGNAGLGLITTTPQAQQGKVNFKEKSITDINKALSNQYGIKG